MKKYRKSFVLILLAFLSVAKVNCQTDNYVCLGFGYFGKMWGEYKNNEADNLIGLSSNSYKDTIGIEEMVDVFYKFKDTLKANRRTFLEKYDVVEPSLRPGDKYVVVSSPLRNHPKHGFRECHAIWDGLAGISIREPVKRLVDKNGISQDELLEELNKDWSKEWVNGEIVMLSNPCWYMGYVVSPRAYLQIYNKGKYITSAPYATYSDFFSYAAFSPFYRLDGAYNWVVKTRRGARLIGMLQSIRTESEYVPKEKTFSVLLHTKINENSEEIGYSLQILEPKKPDKETQELFNSLKEYVESFPSGTFAPYFTTDMRLMIGRYYKVTVNERGWLIQDYLGL